MLGFILAADSTAHACLARKIASFSPKHDVSWKKMLFSSEKDDLELFFIIPKEKWKNSQFTLNLEREKVYLLTVSVKKVKKLPFNSYSNSGKLLLSLFWSKQEMSSVIATILGITYSVLWSSICSFIPNIINKMKNTTTEHPKNSTDVFKIIASKSYTFVKLSRNIEILSLHPTENVLSFNQDK